MVHGAEVCVVAMDWVPSVLHTSVLCIRTYVSGQTYLLYVRTYVLYVRMCVCVLVYGRFAAEITVVIRQSVW